MIMVLRRFLLFLAWLPAVALIAQTSGELRLEIDPPTSFSYRLDHQFTMQRPELELLTPRRSYRDVPSSMCRMKKGIPRTRDAFFLKYDD